MEDLAYYRRRAAEEAMAALAAAHPKVRQVHLQLAEAYVGRIALTEAAFADRRAIRAPIAGTSDRLPRAPFTAATPRRTSDHI